MAVSLSAPALVGWMGLVALVWLAGLVSAVRRAHDTRYRVGPDDEPGSPVRVSVVIPARDEEANIGDAVRCALAQEHPNLQVVVLDDGSTDGTAGILESFDDPRLTVIRGGDEPLPEGWLGKPWACQRAARHATGDVLLFIDADVRIAPCAVSRAVGYLEREEVGLLSGFGRMVMVTLGERVLQPVVAGMILAGNPLAEVNAPDNPEKALANGQFLMFRRAVYEDIGGHEAVADNVVDDIGLARAVKHAGHAAHAVMMQRLFSCRMYTSLAEVWQGWRKNLFAGIHRSWAILGLIVAGSASFVVAPYVVVLLGLVGLVPPDATIAAAVAVVFIQSVRWYLDGVFDQPRWIGVVTHGLANAMVLALFIDSAVSTRAGWVRWKRRVVG